MLGLNLYCVTKSVDACAGLYKECNVLTAAKNALWTLLQHAAGTTIVFLSAVDELFVSEGLCVKYMSHHLHRAKIYWPALLDRVAINYNNN